MLVQNLKLQSVEPLRILSRGGSWGQELSRGSKWDNVFGEPQFSRILGLALVVVLRVPNLAWVCASTVF